MSNETSKVYNGLKSQTVVMVIQSVLQLVYFSIMSRLLTAEDFGYFAILTAVTTIFESISEAGLGASVIQKKDPSKSFISTALTLSLGLGVLSMFLLMGTSGVFSKILVNSSKLTLAFCIMSINLLLSNSISVVRSLYMRKLNFLVYGLYQICAYIISSIVGVVMALNGFGFYSIVVAILSNHLIITILLYILNWRELSLGIDKGSVKEIASYGGWLTATVIVRTIADQLDKMFLSRWLSVTTLGMYNRPAGIVSQVSGKAFGVFDTILFPILSDIQDDKEKITAAYKKAFELIVSLSCLITFILILSSELIVDVFLGSKWENLNILLQLIVLNLVFLAISRIQDCFFRSLNFMKFYFASRVVLCVLTLSALYVACKYNLEAVAIGMIVVRVCETLIKALFLNKKIGVHNKFFFKALFKASYLLTIVFVFCYTIKHYFISGPFAATALFIVIILSVLCFFPNALGKNFYDYVLIKVLSYITGINKKASKNK